MMRKTLGFGGLAAVAALAGFMAWPGRPALISGGSFVMPFHSVRTTDATAAIHKASGPAGTQSGNEQAGVAASDPASVQVAPETTSNTPAKDKLINLAGKQYPVRTYKPLALPNDPLLSGWWINQTRLPESWDIAPGAKQATLAIIDTGFALAHEEFAGRWHVNGGEKGSAATEGASARNCSDRSLPLNASCNLIDDDGDGTTDNETGPATYENPSRLNCTDQAVPLDKSCNRQDDDGNGYVDDLSGWDFNSNDEAPLAGELNPNGTGTTHGTRVAGLAAATGNNAKGIAGVDWQTRILPLQALDDDSYGDTLSVGRAMYYAIAQGADVISLSLGSDLPDEYVRGAVRAALKAGIVVVAASGNDGCDCVVYPANYPEVLAVGALDSTEQVASFSSYGKNVDVLAPGVNVTSTNWQSANRTSAYASGLSGTSFATPMIAGALSRLKSLQPAATPAQLIAAVTENVNRLGLSVPRDDRYGFGTLDAAKTVSRMAVPRTGQISYAFRPVSKGQALGAYEPATNAIIYACEAGSVASTAIQELKKGDSHLFTISQVENHQAVAAGYVSGFLAYACLQQPHDTNTFMRSINVFAEFRNIYPKP